MAQSIVLTVVADNQNYNQTANITKYLMVNRIIDFRDDTSVSGALSHINYQHNKDNQIITNRIWVTVNAAAVKALVEGA